MSACGQRYINMIACVSDMQQLQSVEPGPAIGTQLTQQLRHRSTALWETPVGQVRTCIEVRTCRNRFILFL